MASGENGFVFLFTLLLAGVSKTNSQGYSQYESSFGDPSPGGAGGSMGGFPPGMGVGGGGGGQFPPMGGSGPYGGGGFPAGIPDMGLGSDQGLNPGPVPGQEYPQEYPQELLPSAGGETDPEAAGYEDGDSMQGQGMTDVGSGSAGMMGRDISNTHDNGRGTTDVNDTGREDEDSNTDIKSGVANFTGELGDAQQIQSATQNSTVKVIEEDDFNYVAMYVTIAVMFAFMGTLVAIALIRGPKGPFKTKRSDSEVDMMMAQMSGLRGAKKDELTILDEGGESARTDAQWEQQPLQSNCDHVEDICKNTHHNEKTTLSAPVDEKANDQEKV